MTVRNLTLLGGSGAPAGGHVTHKWPFVFDTPGILTGATAVFTDGYVVTAGDLWISAHVQIDTAWDGTAPSGDIGLFIGGALTGLLQGIGGPLDMTAADRIAGAGQPTNGLLTGSQASDLRELCAINNALAMMEVNGAGPTFKYLGSPPVTQGGRTLSGVLSGDPIKVVVSQDGTIGGADPGSTQGAAILYVTTARL